MSNNNNCLVFGLIFSWVFVGLCEGQGGGGGAAQPACMTQLLPCANYLHQTTAPPSICCVPLKKLVSTEVKCLCDVFNNPAIMKSLNVTQADALDLAKSCGADADESLCKNAAGGPTVSSPSPSPSNSSSNTSAKPEAPSKSAAGRLKMTKSGTTFAAITIYLLVSLF